MKKIKIPRKTEQATNTSAEIVASIDDLLIHIFLRLPIRSLIRFKSVSKHWLSLITTPQFSLLRNPKPNPAVGLFLPRIAFRVNPIYEYVHFDPRNPISNPPFQELKFAEEDDDPSGLRILQSCNGLLLCSSSFRARGSDEHKYYIFNPTTKQYSTLPQLLGPGIDHTSRSIRGVNLAFDPSRSPHYKVVCVIYCLDNSNPDDNYQIQVYSSETGPWRVSGEPFSSNVDFGSGVYWNGSIHWINTWGDSTSTLCYNVELERLGTMPPLPAVLQGWEEEEEERTIAYFGESCDHLHLIEKYGLQIEFNIYEMKRDYSGWLVKYQVDLAVATIQFPTDWSCYAFSIFSLVDNDDDDDKTDGNSFLVLQIPGKAIRYNIASKTLEKLCDIDDGGSDGVAGSFPFPARKAFEYIQSLCCV